MSPVSVRAAAKINLHLGVGSVRPDGFHPLDTVYQAISLHDEVTVDHASGWSLAMTMAEYVDAAGLPLDDSNLVSRAAALLGGRGATVSICKRIPVAGGMAGGSADAAAALVALDRLWEVQTPPQRLAELAAELGSDVPFALVGGTARGIGRGEVVDPIDDPGAWWWVIVPAAVGLSTPEVYRRFDELRPDAGDPPPSDAVLRALTSADPALLAQALRNDLEPAVLDLRPELADVIAAGQAAGALRGMVSGSGPTCVFLCSDETSAEVVAERLRASYDVVLTARGPVPGAIGS